MKCYLEDNFLSSILQSSTMYYNYLLKSLDTTSLESSNENSIKVPKVLSEPISKFFLNLWVQVLFLALLWCLDIKKNKKDYLQRKPANCKDSNDNYYQLHNSFLTSVQ